MNEIYLVVGVDQEGDATWAIARDRAAARKIKREMDECAFENCIKIWHVDLTANVGDDFNAKEVK